jgi:hypothetical protein
LLKFSTEWRDMGQSYRFCAGVRNDSDPTHSAIVPSSRPRAADLNSSKCPKL